MGCFTDIIGVRGLCPDVSPKLALYLDDVGISKDDLQSFLTKQYSGVKDYFDKRSEFAIKDITSTIYKYFLPKFNATSLVDGHRLGIYSDSLALVSGSNYRGINMQFSQDKQFYEFNISEVTLFLDYTGTVTVGIWDLYQDLLLDSIDIDCTAGKKATAYLHKTYKSDKQPMNIFIGYNAAGIDSIKCPIRSGLCCGLTSCSNSYMRAQGIEVTGQKLISNCTTIADTAGLSIVYDLVCDHQSWICQHVKSLDLALAYKIAEVVVSDALYNTSGERATNNHTINRDELKERYAFYKGKYQEALTLALNNMRIPDNKCFQCNTPVRNQIMFP